MAFDVKIPSNRSNPEAKKRFSFRISQDYLRVKAFDDKSRNPEAKRRLIAS